MWKQTSRLRTAVPLWCFLGYRRSPMHSLTHVQLGVLKRPLEDTRRPYICSAVRTRGRPRQPLPTFRKRLHPGPSHPRACLRHGCTLYATCHSLASLSKPLPGCKYCPKKKHQKYNFYVQFVTIIINTYQEIHYTYTHYIFDETFAPSCVLKFECPTSAENTSRQHVSNTNSSSFFTYVLSRNKK